MAEGSSPRYELDDEFGEEEATIDQLRRFVLQVQQTKTNI